MYAAIAIFVYRLVSIPPLAKILSWYIIYTPRRAEKRWEATNLDKGTTPSDTSEKRSTMMKHHSFPTKAKYHNHWNGQWQWGVYFSNVLLLRYFFGMVNLDTELLQICRFTKTPTYLALTSDLKKSKSLVTSRSRLVGRDREVKGPAVTWIPWNIVKLSTHHLRTYIRTFMAYIGLHRLI